MAYLDYNYSPDDTYLSIANFYNITVSELLRINNIGYPHAQKPSEQLGLSEYGSLKVPNTLTGTGTLELEDTDEYLFNQQDSVVKGYLDSRTAGLRGEIGFASQNKCWLQVDGVGVAVFPCYPQSYSDSHNVNFTSQNVMGRSEPFQIYQNSGPRNVSVSFRMDREMTHTTDIGDIIGIVQAACYPTENANTIAPRCTLVIGKNCKITGVIGNVSTNWSETIIDQQYMVVDLSFSITECTGNPKTAYNVRSLRGV